MTEENKDTVGAKNPVYDAVQSSRKIWQDICDGGTEKLRTERSTYFPQFPLEDDDDYSYRCNTATLFNITRKSRDVMLGLIFQEPITLGIDPESPNPAAKDVPPASLKLWEDTDNRGTHGDVFWHTAAEAAFEGYAVVLEDSPNVQVVDAEQERTLGIRPYSILYKADDVWNWRYRINPISKRRELEMIVLRETTEEAAGRFLAKTVTRFLHISQGVNGLVLWARFIEKKDKDGKIVYVPDGDGVFEKQTSIPVSVLRRLGDKPPFQDIALKNIEHAQTYSDYKGVIHKTCVPFPTRIGYEKPANGEATTNSVVIDVPVGGDFKMVEVAGTSIEATRQSLLDMREDISLMGLSILADKTAKVDLTATEALLNNIGETAELRVLARAIQDAIETSQGFRAKYLGLGEDAGGSVTLGTAWNKAEAAAATAALTGAIVDPAAPGDRSTGLTN